MVMVEIEDVYNQIVLINTHLQEIDNVLQVIQGDVTPLHSDLETIHKDVDPLHDDLGTIHKDLAKLHKLHDETNLILYHMSEQNDTIICILEKTSKMTCEILNFVSSQTRLQFSMEKTLNGLFEMYKFDHSQASLDYNKMQELQKQIEKCCPPKPIEPPCSYEPCAKPEKLKDRPKGEDYVPK